MPQVFGWQHIVYLVVFFAAAAGSLVAVKIKVKDEKTLNVIIKSMGGLLLALIIWNRIAICLHKDNNWWLLLPDSFCGFSSLGLAVCALVCKRDQLPLHCFAYLSFWGGGITTFYPDFLPQNESFFYPATISGLLHHSIAFYIAVLMALTGFMKPSLKKFYAFPVGLCMIMCYGLFLIDALKFKKAMYIGQPLISGTFLTWYVVAAMLIVLTLGGVWLYEYLLKRKANAHAVRDGQDELPSEKE